MKIFLRGFFFTNLGDDLFIHMLAKRYPEHTFVMVINKGYEGAFVKEPNIQLIKTNKFVRGIFKICKVDINDKIEKQTELSIIISGSIFQEYKNDTRAMERLLHLPGNNNPTYIVGTNFGPYVTEQYLQTAKEYFRNIKDVCFRDRWSYDIFEELPQVRYAPDIVFNVDNIVEKPLKREKLCVISVMDFDKKEYLKPYREFYENFILHIIDYYVSEQYDIILMSFCKKEGDENAIARIEEACSIEKRERIKTAKYNGNNWKEMVSTIGSASYLIASRFHSMILGMVFQVPILPIVYNDKILHVLQDLGYESYGIRLENLNNTEISKTEFIVCNDIDTIKKQADEQFAALDAIL